MNSADIGPELRDAQAFRSGRCRRHIEVGRPGRRAGRQDRLDDLSFVPEYFLITDFAEYAAYHSDLKDYLETNCSLLADRDRYQIYHRCGS